MPAEEFLQWVADRAGIDRATAQRATEAVLKTLAERIAGGEVDDLVKELPAEFRPILERGKQHSGGRAQKMPLEEFVGASPSGRACPSTSPARTPARC